MTLICALAQQSRLVADMPADTSWLEPDEGQRLAGFSAPGRRRSYLAGRWLARKCLLGWPDASQPRRLGIDTQGRSHIHGEPRLHASISHSGDWVAAAVATAPIGIDIEDLGRQRDFAALASAVLSPAQCADLSPQSFYQWWTLKEAWFKRQGLGLDIALMKSLDYLECGTEPMTAASFVDAEHGLVLALDSPALADLSLLDLGVSRLAPTLRLKSPSPRP